MWFLQLWVLPVVVVADVLITLTEAAQRGIRQVAHSVRRYRLARRDPTTLR